MEFCTALNVAPQWFESSVDAFDVAAMVRANLGISFLPVSMAQTGLAGVRFVQDVLVPGLTVSTSIGVLPGGSPLAHRIWRAVAEGTSTAAT